MVSTLVNDMQHGSEIRDLPSRRSCGDSATALAGGFVLEIRSANKDHKVRDGYCVYVDPSSITGTRQEKASLTVVDCYSCSREVVFSVLLGIAVHITVHVIRWLMIPGQVEHSFHPN